MSPSLLIGLVTGLRAMTPLAAVSVAARAGRLPLRDRDARRLGQGAVAAFVTAMAVGELFDDKLKSAPDRTVPAGLAARILTGAIAGAALERPGRKSWGALLGVVGAILAGYVGLSARKAAMRRFGQTSTGLVEDAIAVGAAALLVTAVGRR